MTVNTRKIDKIMLPAAHITVLRHWLTITPSAQKFNMVHFRTYLA